MTPSIRMMPALSRMRICAAMLLSICPACRSGFSGQRSRHGAISIGCSVLVGKTPFAIHRNGGKVIVGICAFVARSPVADLEIDDVLRGLIDQVVAIPGCCLEAGAHAGRQPRLSVIGVQGRIALKNVCLLYTSPSPRDS